MSTIRDAFETLARYWLRWAFLGFISGLLAGIVGAPFLFCYITFDDLGKAKHFIPVVMLHCAYAGAVLGVLVGFLVGTLFGLARLVMAVLGYRRLDEPSEVDYEVPSPWIEYEPRELDHLLTAKRKNTEKGARGDP